MSSAHNMVPELEFLRSILIPSLCFQSFALRFRERMNESFGQLAVGDERNAEIDRLAADDEAVGIFHTPAFSGNVDDEVDAAALEEFGDVGRFFCRNFVYFLTFDP